LIPLILANTKYVNSFIVCKLDGGVTIRMIRGREYPNYGFNSSQDSINAQKVSMACMALEYESYGHDKFDIKDNRLFNYLPSNGIWKGAKLKIRPKSSNQPLTTQNVGGGMVTIFFSYEIEIEFENPFGVICPAGQSCNWVYTATVYDNYTFWMEGDPSGNPNPWPENPWTNGYDPCNGIPCTPVIEAWQYIEAPASVSLNQSIIDSLRGYPCAQSILAQLPGINNEVQTMLAVFVNNSTPVDVKFSVDSSSIGTLTNGYTPINPQKINGVITWTINLNPWVLTHSTKEFIFATLVHESLHAFMLYQWNLLQTGQMDTATFKATYPIFYTYRTIGGPSIAELAQHQEMTFRYISFMSNALNSFNSNITYHTANELAWEGLRETSLWHINYNDTTSINNTNNIARDTSSHQYYQFPYFLTACP
jgi:hypothetical protein